MRLARPLCDNPKVPPPGTVRRLTPYSVTVFAEMSALAARVGAVNLGQGFPDEDGPPAMLAAAQQAIADAYTTVGRELGATVVPVGRAWQAFLREHEAGRGWFTGCFGWMDGSGNGAFAVILRALLLRGTRAHLFAGTGIVRGSEPARELAEKHGWRTILTDSAKLANIIPGYGYNPVFRPTDVCESPDGRFLFVSDWGYGGWTAKDVTGRLWRVRRAGDSAGVTPAATTGPACSPDRAWPASAT